MSLNALVKSKLKDSGDASDADSKPPAAATKPTSEMAGCGGGEEQEEAGVDPLEEYDKREKKADGEQSKNEEGMEAVGI